MKKMYSVLVAFLVTMTMVGCNEATAKPAAPAKVQSV